MTEDEDAIALTRAGAALMAELCREFPRFVLPWREHHGDWDHEPAGAYNDISVFAHFVEDALFERGEVEEVKRAFLILERLFVEGNEPTRDLIGIGFVEDLQNISSGRKGGHAAILPLLPRTLLRVWWEIDRQWANRLSLLEVLEAELQSPQESSTWDELLKRGKTLGE